MATDQARELRRQGIAAAKAGENDRARALLQQSIRLDPRNEAAWVWLASLARDQRERLFCFQKLLQINPQNETALQALAAMKIAPEQLLGAARSAPQAPAQTAAPQRAGVPILDPQRLAAAQAQADRLVQAYVDSLAADSGVEWVRKSKGRAGERDALYLRLKIAGAVAGFLVALGAIGALVVANDPQLRGVVFAPTWTPSPTPTLTPTPTPGFTPTPSVTPAVSPTASPTIDPSITPGSIDAPPRPTRIYPDTGSRIISDAVALINQRRFTAAIATLEAERAAASLSLNASAYLYEAIARTDAGDPEAALRLLDEAEAHLRDRPDAAARPLLDTAYAYALLELARRARDQGLAQEASGYLTQVTDRARAAADGDPRLALPYVLLARRYALERRYDDALAALDRGLAVPQLAADVNLIVEKGEVHFAQGDLDQAARQAFVALYIDPTVEKAYLLQIKTALAQGDPGLAVIYAQNYLFFYPGSAEGFKLLGDARVAEGNTDQALAAYNQALAAEETTPVTAAALAARAALYSAQGRYDMARDDLTRAYSIDQSLQTRAQRMRAAYAAGSYGTASSDAEALLGSGALPDDEIRLLQARILVDQARGGDTETFASALALIPEPDSLPLALQPTAHEYRARAQYGLGEFDDALRSVDAALARVETGSRRFLRGLILEARGETQAALREYDWVVTWSAVYPYPFAAEARRRRDALRGEPPQTG
ncbi:MAG: tetratricopeptide repeat protein [Aggregatilineales bacterium]